jgi:hypothetical protein
MKMLKRQLVILGLAIGILGVMHGSLGATTYINDNKGNSATARTIGGTTYVNDNKGTATTARTIGGTTYINDNKGTATTIRK